MATIRITMAGDVKLPLKTFRFRVKDKTSGKKLDAAAREANLVWNHCAMLSSMTSVGPEKGNFRHPPAGLQR